KTRSSQPELLAIKNGKCILNGITVGSPCEVQTVRTVITFSEVPDYDILELSNSKNTYKVFFMKDCEFPTPKFGQIIVERSIPLYRFLGNKTEENVVFAMK
ncbi:unnamed protein product, partial [Hymenolepis diminuta]